MGLNDPSFAESDIDCFEALFLFDAGNEHAMAHVRLLDDDGNEESGLCWCETTYVLEFGQWAEYGGNRYWDYNNADEFAVGEADLPYGLVQSATVYGYRGAKAFQMFQNLTGSNWDFNDGDISQADFTIF